MLKKKEKTLKKLYNFLLFTTIGITVLIGAGTMMGIKKTSEKPVLEERTAQRDGKALFSDLGRLRALTSDAKAGTAVIFPILEYEAVEKDFEEELVQKKETIRQTVITWFSKKSMYELYTMPNKTIKKEILDSINSVLDLSKIKNIYFKEFVILT